MYFIKIRQEVFIYTFFLFYKQLSHSQKSATFTVTCVAGVLTMQ